MADDLFFSLKTLAILLLLIAGLSITVGIADLRQFIVPGAWSLLSGLLMILIGYYVWTEKAVGWKVALGVVALDVLIWALLAFFLVNRIGRMAGVSGPDVELVRGALVNRFRASAAVATIVAFWVYPSRHKFVH
jgi:hypothetical protein